MITKEKILEMLEDSKKRNPLHRKLIDNLLDLVENSNDVEDLESCEYWEQFFSEKIHEVADGAVSPYNSERVARLAEDLRRSGAVEKACVELGFEFGGKSNLGIFDAIARGRVEENRERLREIVNEILEKLGEE